MDMTDPDLIARIREAVAGLPEPARTIFRLHAVERLDYAAIAERLDLDVGEVERRLAEALVALDRQLGAAPNARQAGRAGATRVRGRLHRLARRLGFG